MYQSLDFALVRGDDPRAMAAYGARIPPPRRRRWPARVLGLLATAALLGSGVAIALMVMPSDKEEAAAPSATAAPKTEKEKGLTKSQKAARRDAVATVRDQGYEPVRLADWRPDAELRVLIGRDDTGAMRAFFFVDRKFVGNDDASTSGQLRVTSAGRHGVTLTYRLTTGGTEKVRFRWEDSALAPSSPVPPVTLR